MLYSSREVTFRVNSVVEARRLLTIPSELAVAVVAEARQLRNVPEVAPLPPDRGAEQKLVQLQQAYDAEILTRGI
jgi:hypothetical protein